MNQVYLEFEYGVCWLFACQQLGLANFQLELLKRYRSIGLSLSRAYFSHLHQIESFLRPSIDRVSFVKIAYFGQIVDRIEQNNILGIPLQKYQYPEANIQEVSNVIKRAFEQMEMYMKRCSFTQIFRSLSGQRWKQLQLPSLIKRYALINDTFVSQEETKMFGSTVSLDLLPNDTDIYCSDKDRVLLQRLIKGKFKEIETSEMEVLATSSICRKLSLRIRSINQKSIVKQNKVICFKIIRSVDQYRENQHFFFLNNFDSFFQESYFKTKESFTKILQQKVQLLLPSQKLTVVKIEAKYERFNRHMNFGFKVEKIQDKIYIIFNCFTLLHLVNRRTAVYYKINGQYYWDIQEEQLAKICGDDCIEKFECLVYEFERVEQQSFLYLENYQNALKDKNQEIANLIYFFNYLEQHKQNLEIEYAQFLAGNHMMASKILQQKQRRSQLELGQTSNVSKNSLLREKIGLEQNMIQQLFPQEMRSISISSVLLRNISTSIRYLAQGQKLFQTYATMQDQNKKEIYLAKNIHDISGYMLKIAEIFALYEGKLQDEQRAGGYMMNLLSSVKNNIQKMAHTICHPNEAADKQVIQQGFLSIYCSCFNSKKVVCDAEQKAQRHQQYISMKYFGCNSAGTRLTRLNERIIQSYQVFRKTLYQIKSLGIDCQQFQNIFYQCSNRKNALQKDIQNLKSKVNNPYSDCKMKENSYQQLLIKYQQQCKDYVRASKNPMGELSITKQGILQGSSIILDWTKINTQFNNLEALNYRLTIKLQELISNYNKLGYSYEKMENAYIVRAKSIELSIQIMKINSYSDDSLEVLMLYKCLASIYQKISRPQKLLNLLCKIKCKKEQNKSFINAYIHNGVAEVYYHLQQAELCSKNIQISIEQYRGRDEALNHIIGKYPRQYYRYIIKLQLMLIKLKLINIYLLKVDDLNMINQSIQKTMEEWKEWKASIKQKMLIIYEKQAKLLQIQIKSAMTNINFSNSKEIIKSYQEIIDVNRIQLSILGYQLVLICIDTLLINYNQKQNPPFTANNILQKMQSNLLTIPQQIEQSTQLKWVYSLLLFLKQRADFQKADFDLEDACRHIKNVIIVFKELKFEKKLMPEMKRYYYKIYKLYAKFMEINFKGFPALPNMYEKAKQPKQNTRLKNKERILILFTLKEDIFEQVYKKYSRSRLKNILSDPFARNIEELEQKIKIISDKNGQAQVIIDYSLWTASAKQLQAFLNNYQYFFLNIYVFDDRRSFVSGSRPNIPNINYIDNLKYLSKNQITQLVNTYKQSIKIQRQAILVQNIQNRSVINQNKVLISTIFFKDQNRRKWVNYHSKIQYFTSIYDQTEINDKNIIQKIKTIKTPLQYQKNNEATEIINIQRQMQIVLHLSQQNLLPELMELMTQFDKHAGKILQKYQREDAKYYLEVNMLLRQIYNYPCDKREDLFQKHRSLPLGRSLVFPLYHSIKFRFLYGPKQSKNSLFRYQFMGKQQFIQYEKCDGKQIYIKMTYFYSTSKSPRYALQELQNRFKKNELDNYVLVEIKFKPDQLMQSSGYCSLSLENNEEEILFNIENIFKINKVLKDKKIRQLLQDKDCSLWIDNKFKQNAATFLNEEIRYIQLQYANFNISLSEQIVRKNPQTQEFLHFQKAFIEQKKSTETIKIDKMDKMVFNFYDIIQCYLDHGFCELAEEQIIKRLATDPDSIISYFTSNSPRNMVYRLLEIYQKEGKYRLSKELITKILPSIHRQLQESTDISTKWLLRNSAIDLRIQAIKIYRQKHEVKRYSQNICLISRQIQQIEKENEARINKLQQIQTNISGQQSQQIERNRQEYEKRSIQLKQKKIFLEFQRSIIYLQTNSIEKSLCSFSDTIAQIKELVQLLKKLINKSKQQLLLKAKDICNQAIDNLSRLLSDYQRRGVKDIEAIKQVASQIPNTLKLINRLTLKHSDEQKCIYHSKHQLNHARGLSIDSPSKAQIVLQELRNIHYATQNIREKSSTNKSELVMKVNQINFNLYGQMQTQKQMLQNLSFQGMKQTQRRMSQIKMSILSTILEDFKQMGFKQNSFEIAKHELQFQKQKIYQQPGDLQCENLMKQIYKNSKAECITIEKCRSIIYIAQLKYQNLNRQLSSSQSLKEKISFQKMESYCKQTCNLLKGALAQLQKAYGLISLQSSWMQIIHRKFNRNRQIDHSDIKQQLRLCDQNISIKLLQLKICYLKCEFHQQNPIVIQMIRLKLQELGTLLFDKDKFYDVRSQYIIFYGIHIKYGVFILKQMNLDYYSEFKSRIRERFELKGPNNIQNAIDCVDVYRMLSISTKRQIKLLFNRDKARFYSYISEATTSCHNNGLYWKFMLCRYQQIVPDYMKMEQYFKKRLQFLYYTLQTMNKETIINQVGVGRINQLFDNFVKFRKLKNNNHQIREIILKKQSLWTQIEKKIPKQDRASLEGEMSYQQLLNYHS